jgi:serine/threonine protein kinase
MGEVYRADDLKLGQPVALKFLPPGLDADPERLNRFLNEVRIAPNAAPVITPVGWRRAIHAPGMIAG